MHFYFILQQNRPLNSQNVADSLQKFNLKKAAVQKALDSLADSGKISFKEYGKQKIYMARQDQFNIPNNEELNQMKEENAKLQEQLNEQKKAIADVEAGKNIVQKTLYFRFSSSESSSYNFTCCMYEFLVYPSIISYMLFSKGNIYLYSKHVIIHM